MGSSNPGLNLHSSTGWRFFLALMRSCVVSAPIAVRFLLRVPTTTAADAKLGTAHVIGPSLENSGLGLFYVDAIRF